MAWVRLTNSTAADANEVHANFQEIRSGTLLPMKLSTTAATTSGAYDIGSSAKKWKDGYFSGSVTAANITTTGTATAADIILTDKKYPRVTALNGTANTTTFSLNVPTVTGYSFLKIHLLLLSKASTTSNWNLRATFNGVSAGANYYWNSNVEFYSTAGTSVVTSTTFTGFDRATLWAGPSHRFSGTITALANLEICVASANNEIRGSCDILSEATATAHALIAVRMTSTVGSIRSMAIVCQATVTTYKISMELIP